MDATAVNTVLLAIVLPVLGAVAFILYKLNKTLGRLDVALSGYNGKGGALAEIVSLRKRVHHLENIATTLLVATGVEAPDFHPGG